MRGGICIGLLVLVGYVGFSHADSADVKQDVFSLSAHATRDVDNDRVSAGLNVLAEGAKPADVADEVNRRMRSALTALAEYPAVDAEVRAYRTEPRYETSNTGKRRLVGWRASQALRLESTDVAMMSEALAVLQQDLQVQNLHFDVTGEARDLVTDELIVEALAALRARAALVADSMGRDNYRILQADIATEAPGTLSHRTEFAVMEARSAVAAPALEGGDTQIRVRVDARIQLFDGEQGQ